MKILATAPARISLFGGGTDVPSYFTKYGGKVINMAINLRQHVKVYVGDDLFGHNGNKFPYDADPRLFYEIFKKYGLNGIHHIGIRSEFDGFVKSGLGSSASAAVALIGGFYKHIGKKLDRAAIAEEAWDIEVNTLGWYGGKQDQYAAAYGGMNLIEFGKQVKVTPLPRKQAENLLFSMVLIYIGGTRESRDIQKGFKELTEEQIKALDAIKSYVDKAQHYINRGDLRSVGTLMHEVWQLKKKSNKGVSNPKIDEIYNYAFENGALGGKILGAGGAGYMLFIVKPEDKENFIGKMKENGYEDIDFSIDWNGVEARIVSGVEL